MQCPIPLVGSTIFQLTSDLSDHISPDGSSVWKNDVWEPFPSGQRFLPYVWYATSNDKECPIPLNA